MVKTFEQISPALVGMSGQGVLDLVEGWEHSHG